MSGGVAGSRASVDDALLRESSMECKKRRVLCWTDTQVIFSKGQFNFSTNWPLMVIPFNTTKTLNGVLVKERACVFCGKNGDSASKIVKISYVYALIDNQNSEELDMTFDTFHQTLQNICMTSSMYHECHEGPETLSACACCFHWLERQDKRKCDLLPMQSLRWHFHTLFKVSNKMLDTRVIVRLCETLVETKYGLQNYYYSLFSDQEKELIRRISECDQKSVKFEIASFFEKMNGKSMFLKNSKVGVTLRESKIVKFG